MVLIKMTDVPVNDDQRRWREEAIERAWQLQNLSDHELIATAPGPKDDRYPMEMTRRLKDSIGELTIGLKHSSHPRTCWQGGLCTSPPC